METGRIPFAILGLLVSLAAVGLAAQPASIKGASPLTDAVVAAPKNHRVLYEDAHIRLLEVIVQPGETENWHTHSWASALIFDGPQPRLRNELASGGSVEFGRNFELPSDATVPPQLAAIVNAEHDQLQRQELSNWSDSTPVVAALGPDHAGAHRITNLDTFPHHFYRLEFKKLEGNALAKRSSY